MQIQVEVNPNGPGSEQFVFKELGKPRPVKAIVAEVKGKETICDVTGVDEGGLWVPAVALKIADSSDGHAFLIHGGRWGLRFKSADSKEPWDLLSADQWGEPFKIYGSEADIIYR